MLCIAKAGTNQKILIILLINMQDLINLTLLMFISTSDRIA